MSRAARCSHNLLLALTAVVLSALLNLALVRRVESSPRPREAEFKRSVEELSSMCRQIPGFKKISQMEALIEALKLVMNQEIYKSYRRTLLANQGLDAGSAASSSPSPLTTPIKMWTYRSMTPCLKHASAIVDLGAFISDKANVCSSVHIDKIENYFNRYIRRPVSSRPKNRNESSSVNARRGDLASQKASRRTHKPITTEFFELYAKQVSFLCKSRLLHSLRAIEMEQLANEDGYSKDLPWLNYVNSRACKSLERRKTFASSLENRTLQVPGIPEGELTSEEVRHCEASKALSLISFDELTEAFEEEKLTASCKSTGPHLNRNGDERVESETESGPESVGAEELGCGNINKSGLFLIVPPNQIELVKNMINTCTRLRPIYMETVLPIVRLARLGYNPNFKNFDKVCSKETLIQKWFGITLVCNSILSSHLTDIDKYEELKTEFQAGEKSFVVVDDEEERTVSHADEAKDEIRASPSTNWRSVLEKNKTPIDDELWVYRYSGNSLNRFKDSLLRKVFKIFKVEDIDDHIVFRAHIQAINHWIVRVVIVTVSLLALK